MDTTTMDCWNIGIIAEPLNQEPPLIKKHIPDKILAILRKYKYFWNWRIEQLSKPNRITRKYVFVDDSQPLKYEKAKEVKLDEEIKFYADQLATPALKNLICNKMDYGKTNRKLNRKLTRNLKKAWKSIYNFYRNREREKKLRNLRRTQAEKKKEEKPKTFARAAVLAIPKKYYQPPPPKKGKIFENYDDLDILAAPKVYIIQPAKRVGVNPRALTYEPTEVVFRLAKLPKRFENQPKPLEPGAVKRAALRYKITPRTEALCVPKTTREKANEDDGFDPWAISKNALKYKPTPRIIELAKARE
ncbi:hypothetical protein NQ315_003750 [Exocentrus adspersus]|uniref:Testicular haploid expressed gene protein-like n=1 Tax=Exocentrus adspersus TaxID=1586481 RepID=A0AAV8VJ79_9CUCU|nr:hypothetical protein NQ315_003750 [Exocentrus adspersus]